MNDKVLSIEQMLHLQELGVDTNNASMFHVLELRPKEGDCLLAIKKYTGVRYIPTYTLHDIIEMLPVRVKWHPLIIVGNKVMYSSGYGEGYDNPFVKFEEGTLLQSAYKMLCWCAKNGYLN